MLLDNIKDNAAYNPFPYIERIIRMNLPPLFLLFVFCLALIIFWKVMTAWRSK